MDDLGVVVVDAVVEDMAARGAATLLGVDGVGEMPFYEGVARDEGNIVEVEDLGWVSDTAIDNCTY